MVAHRVGHHAFERGDIYSAAAGSIVLAVVMLTFSLAFLRVIAKRGFTGEQR